MFKVNKNTRTILLLLSTYFIPFSSVSIVGFELANVSWEEILIDIYFNVKLFTVVPLRKIFHNKGFL